MSENFTQANSPMKLSTPLGLDALLLTGLTAREGLSHRSLSAGPRRQEQQNIAFDKLLGQTVDRRARSLPAERSGSSTASSAASARGPATASSPATGPSWCRSSGC